MELEKKLCVSNFNMWFLRAVGPCGKNKVSTANKKTFAYGCRTIILLDARLEEPQTFESICGQAASLISIKVFTPDVYSESIRFFFGI